MDRPEQLAQSDEIFRLLVSSVKDYAIFLLDPGGVIRSWNGGAECIKGYKAAEIIGHHFSKFYPPEDVASGKCERELDLALREGRFEDIGWRVRKDGSRFWANVVITALVDASGRHVGFVKVTKDLTSSAYRTFVEATNAIVWTADATGKANVDSPSWRAFTGQTRDEWLGRRAFEPVHPDDRSLTAELWAQAKKEKHPFEAEFRLLRHDGAYVWMGSRAIPMLDVDGSVREWFGVTFDIQARKTAEDQAAAALRREHEARVRTERAEALWTTTLRSIGDGVIATDLHGHVTFMNPIAQSLTGWSPEDAVGKPLGEVFRIMNEQTRLPAENPVVKVLESGIIVGLANHTVLAQRGGREIPIDDSAAPIRDGEEKLFGVVLVFRDATKEKRDSARREFLVRAGEALATAVDYQDSLRTIASFAVPELADWCAVSVVEPGEDRPKQVALAHVDPAKIAFARELERRYPPDPNATTGVPNVIRTGQSELYKVIPRELLDSAAIDDEHRRILHELELRSAMVVPLRGRERILGAITFIYAGSGRHYGSDDLAFAEELARRAAIVVERRRMEEERAILLERERRAREQADLANRLKDEFLATASHELRNPLQAILGWSAVLLKKDLPADAKKALRTIERNAHAQARLIEDVLDVSRIMSGKLRLDLGDASVAQAIADAVDSLRPEAEAKGVSLVVRVEPEIEVRADAVRLQQVAANLVSNAIKFTPKGGTVSVDAGLRGSSVVITVRDSGEGIDPAFLPAIFEPFRQADASTTRRHGGLGLGLAIVRQLVHAHGGKVEAASEGKGHGSTFTVALPARTSERTPERAAAPASITLDGMRILVVDDQQDAVELLAFILAGAGASVASARSAEEALETLIDYRPDVLVSDIGMPDVDGYALIRRVRTLGAMSGGDTPAVALTAYAAAEDAERCLAAGFQTHLAKPVDADQLVAAVASVGSLRRR